MGISGVSAARKPVPKAVCPGCGRPVVMLKSDRCLYCGVETGTAAAPAATASRIPAQALIALEPRARENGTGSRWMRRAVALGIAGLLLALFVGQCMKT